MRLLYGAEPGTTAIHLQRALERHTRLVVRGPGHPPPEASDDNGDGDPSVWVESGVEWVPSLEELSPGPAVCWLIDTHRGMGWRSRLAAAFDHAFVAQQDAVEAVKARGVNGEWLPLAAPAELAGPGPELADRPYDFAFVGQRWPGSFRAAVVDALCEKYSMAPVDGFVPPEKMMDLYRSARAVVNVPLANDLNMRTFEAVAARALLLTGPASKLDAVLPAGAFVMVQDRDPQAWVDALGRALGSADAQERADEAHHHVIAHHTYDNRAARVLEVLDDARRSRRPAGARAAALGAAHARWGQLGAIGGLPIRPRDRAGLSLEGLAWLGLRKANDVRRGLPHRVATPRT
ncbi:MAG: glycosyltransferase family protein [Acidimicrobiales bacterium]